MLMFLGYCLPIIILIGSLIIFKKLFVKSVKVSDGYRRKIEQEPIKFPLWKYILYIGCSLIPILNWLFLVALGMILLMNDYFCSYSWTGRDYYYEIPEETYEKVNNTIVKIIENLFSKKWFILMIYPFVKIYKFMTKPI